MRSSAPIASARTEAWQLRSVSAGGVLLLLLAAHALWPEAERRAELLTLAALSLGYGHLLGPLLLSRARHAALRSRRGDRALRAGFLGVSLAVAAGVYLCAVASWPPLALPLLALSTWHVVENDAALEAALARPEEPPPLPRSASTHALTLGWTALLSSLFLDALGEAPPGVLLALPPPWTPTVEAARAVALACSLGVALCTGGGAQRAALVLVAAAMLAPALHGHAGFFELFAALSLYHQGVWLLLPGARARHRGRRFGNRARVRIAALHIAGLGLGGVVLLGPPALQTGLRATLFTPEVYLFWSSLHALATLRARAAPARHPRTRAGAPERFAVG